MSTSEDLLEKTNIPGYLKNTETNVVINTNMHQYKTVLQQREKAKELNDLKNEMDSLKDDISEIKNLLVKVISKDG
jgi:hypothetical protein